MNTSYRQETAKIYQFPQRPPSVARGQQQGQRDVSDIAAQRMPFIQWGNSWYHEAALQDVDRSRKP